MDGVDVALGIVALCLALLIISFINDDRKDE